jgi:hypothetical protein
MLGHSPSGRPILFVYHPQAFMSQFMSAYKKVIGDYAEVFDFYYTDDEAFASSHFNIR